MHTTQNYCPSPSEIYIGHGKHLFSVLSQTHALKHRHCDELYRQVTSKDKEAGDAVSGAIL